jgi:hypothetical protein
MNSNRYKFWPVPVLVLGIWWGSGPGRLQGQAPAWTGQRPFSTPAEASQGLMAAVKAHDQQAIRELFGPEVTNLLTGDAVLDEKHFETFAADLAEHCELLPQGSNKVTLEIGRELWPFPIPLIKTNGAWVFDTMAGEEEIINRHIGRDEYYAIGVCRAYVTVQREYGRRFAGADGTPKYAQRLKSQPGKKDGLYWPPEAGGAPSPLSSFVADASLEGYTWSNARGPRSFHGYFFKILTRQGSAAPGGKSNYIRNGEMTGGFALVAYPVRWGESGIMTFLVNQDGVVYQRDLGQKTTTIAAGLKAYNPDARWTVVREPGITDFSAERPGEPAR